MLTTKSNNLLHLVTIQYNAVSIEALVQSRWSAAVDSSPAPLPWVRSRLRSHWCALKRLSLFGSNKRLNVCVHFQPANSISFACSGWYHFKQDDFSVIFNILLPNKQ